MRIAIRWLCPFLLTFGALACGNDAAEPCSAADAAAGRCQVKRETPAALPPGAILPDWALRLCSDWRRPDGSCDQAEIMLDFRECLSQKGAPEQQRLQAQGVGNRASLRAGERATHLCLELRRWFMTPDAEDAWLGRPKRSAPAS